MHWHDNLTEYRDPLIYDLENPDFEPDGPFFLALAKRVGGPILELGCGTGRITIPLAQCGFDITGVDVVPEMLARARKKADELPIRWVAADARTLRLDTRFRLIIATGAILEHLLERRDHEFILARVHEHLARGGRFALGVVFPRPHLMRDVDQEEDWFSYVNAEGQQVRVSGTQHYDPMRQVRTETAFRRWCDEQGQANVRKAPLALRLFFPQEIEALLHYNGFSIVERYGDWGRGPLTDESRSIILVCRKKD